MSSNARDLTVNLVGNTSGLTGPFARLGSFMRGPAGLAAVVGAGAIAAGAGFLRLGENFDEAFDTIRTNTGATGGDLDGLQQSFKDVFSTVPADMGTVSEAISGLNQRLGLTGQPLEDLSTQMINLSRITGTDLGANIEQSTRLFGDWGISTEDMAGSMDEMFRASQASGVGVDQLAGSMVQFGGPLRQMGFGFEESLALFAKFEAEGVNTELVMGSMRIALGKMAKAGEDAPATFSRVTEEIAAMEDPTAATAMAIELFGARAGPDMAAAIREGRFEVDEYMAAIEGGTDTINGAAGATDDWRQKLQVFGNRMMVALEPLATRLLDGLGKAFERLGPVIEKFTGFLDDVFAGDWEAVKQGLSDFVNAAVPIAREALKAFASVLLDAGKALLNGLWQGMQSVWDDPVLPWLKSLPGKAAEGLGALGEFLVDKGKDLLNGLWKGAQALWDDPILPWLKSLPGLAWDGLGELGKFLLDKGKDLLNGLWQGAQDVWDDTVLPWLEKLPGTILTAVPSLLKTLLSRGKQALNGVMNGIREVWNNTIRPWLGRLGTTILTAVPSLLTTLLSRGKQALNGVMNGIRNVWNDTIRPWLGGLGGKILGAVGSLARTLYNAGRGVIRGLWNGAIALWGSVKPWLGGRGGAIVGAVGSLSRTLYSAGRGVIRGLWNGMISLWGEVAGWLGGLGGKIIDLKGPPEYDAAILTDNGRLIMQGLRAGLSDGWQDTKNLLKSMTSELPGMGSDSSLSLLHGGGDVVPSAGAGSVGGAVYHVTVNMPPGSNGDDVVRALREYQRRSGPVPIKTRAS